jgi:membrane protein
VLFMGKTALELLKRSYEEWRADGAPQIAAALTYYTLLSVAPLLIVLVSVVGRVIGRTAVTDNIIGQAYTLAGPLGEQVARELLRTAAPTTLGTAASALAVAIAIFGAMRVFGQLRIAFDRVWNIPPEEPVEGGLAEQIRAGLSAFGRHNLAAFLMVVAVAVLLIASLLVSSAIAFAAPYVSEFLTIGAGALRVIESAISLALVTLLIAIVYRYLPRTRIAWRDVWVGAAITALLFTVGRLLLGVYFTQASPGSAYGAAGSIVALLLWVNYSSQLALFGAEVTHVWTYTHGSRASEDKAE